MFVGVTLPCNGNGGEYVHLLGKYYASQGPVDPLTAEKQCLDINGVLPTFKDPSKVGIGRILACKYFCIMKNLIVRFDHN